MKRVDLHGLDIQRASAAVLNALYEFRQSGGWENKLQIVTGNGTGSLQNLVEEILDSENVDWEYGNSNHSVFNIYK